MPDRPNVLLVISDQERARDWIPDELQARLPNRGRLLRDGLVRLVHEPRARRTI